MNSPQDIVLFVEVEPWEGQHLFRCLPYMHCETFRKRLEDYKGDLSNVTVLSTFINSKVDEAALDRLPRLRFITTRSTGFDHIDLVSCRRRHITVCNVPTYGSATVAEHTFALLLAISRKLRESIERTREGSFDFHQLQGFDLEGKVIGILGTGRIGTHVARIAKGFGMTVLGYDTRPNKQAAEDIGFLYVTVDQLLKNSDIISLHLPYAKDTHHFLGKEEFGKMKKGVVIINTARGGLIDTEALLAALDDGTVKAAGLDVLEEEGLLKEERELLAGGLPRKKLHIALENTVLLKRPNVIITPHNAFNSEESIKRILDTTIENIQKFFAGHPQNVVND